MESKRIELYNRIEYLNEQGQLHRLDGPAVEYSNGGKSWWVNNKRHREDGPAIEYSDGGKRYYLNDVYYTEDQFNQAVIKLKLNRLVNENRTSK